MPSLEWSCILRCSQKTHCPPSDVKFDTLKLKFCTVYILLCQFVIFFTYTTLFMSAPRLSFPDYLMGDMHSAWMAVAPAQESISMPATMRHDVEQQGEGRTPWLQQLPASVQHAGNPEELLEAVTYFCIL